ncbi:MAG TPA: LCP family protein, partial [Streptosporangiaceae bacterium]|nr:LCP family protein [Streptosporangiaceae bacterium]
MSEDWRGWYQNKPGSGYEPTEAYQGGGAGGHGGAGGYGGAAANPAGAWPSQPPTRSAPGGGEPERRDLGGGGGRRWRFWGRPGRRGRRIALILGTAVVVLIAGVAGTYFWMNGKLNRSVALPATSLTSAGTNWLITGSDSRAGLSRAEIDALHVGFDEGTLNSDSIMLLHMGSGRPVLVSIPRDSYVNIPGHGYNKINAALAYGGANLLIQTVENVTGLKIDHYMGIGFGGLVAVVNKIGGVQICLKTAINDSYSGVHLSAGCHNLNGDQALAFVRDRHSFATEDLQRIQDQRAFLSALLQKATSPGVYLNPFTALPFGSTAASSMSVDNGTSLLDLVHAASALRNPETGTVPVADSNYETSAGDAVLWNKTEATELFNALKND